MAAAVSLERALHVLGENDNDVEFLRKGSEKDWEPNNIFKFNWLTFGPRVMLSV